MYTAKAEAERKAVAAKGGNPYETLAGRTAGNDRSAAWISQNTAILVIHGIGNQQPMETLEQFGKTLVHTYQEQLHDYNISAEHRLALKKADNDERTWYDNFIRIRSRGSGHYIDVYEYYWAHHTEGRADWADIDSWIRGITSGARRFYERNEALAATYNDQSLLTASGFSYHFFMTFVSRLVLLMRGIHQGIRGLLSRIPLLGSLLTRGYSNVTQGTASVVANVIGDIVAYSVTDAKSKYYPVRRAILDGAVKALRYLVEHGVTDEDGKLKKRADGDPALARTYPRILVAGHSLGSIVAYDALNDLNLSVNACRLDSYRQDGSCVISADARQLKDQFAGLVTFGSPLDKQAFFLRENIPDDQFVRQQLLGHFHGFKQKNWSLQAEAQYGYFAVRNEASPEQLLDDILWRNYFDRHDYVSGDLDYYGPLTNIDCRFRGNLFSFTHSDYWTCRDFYSDIIRHFLK